MTEIDEKAAAEGSPARGVKPVRRHRGAASPAVMEASASRPAMLPEADLVGLDPGPYGMVEG